MSDHEHIHAGAGVRRDLDAIEAALRGEPVSGDGATIAQLARTLQGMRPRPAPEFVRALDARAARGFPRADHTRREHPGRRGARGGEHSRAPRRRGALRASDALRATPRLPALGLAVSVVVLGALVIALALPGSHRTVATPRPGAAPFAAAGTPREARGAGPASPAAAGTNAAKGTAAATEPKAGATAGSAAARQIERTSSLDVGVAPGAVESTAQRVFTLVSTYGGYVRQSNVSSGGEAGASFDVRVPTRGLAGAIAALSHLGHVRSENDTTNDVTDRYGALRRSLGDAQAERASLLKQLAAADGSTRAAAVRARLRAVEAQIAGLQSALRALTTRIDYTPLALSLTAEHTAGPAAGDLTLGGAAHDADRVLDAALAVLVIAAAAALPIGCVAIVVWGVIVLMRRRWREQALDLS